MMLAISEIYCETIGQDKTPEFSNIRLQLSES